MKLHLITPGRCTEKFAPALFASVLPQLGEHDCWTWIDDASTDSSIDVARELVDADARITIVANVERKGMLDNLITVARRVAHDAITIQFDADDVLAPEALEKIRAAFADENVWCAHGGVARLGQTYRYAGPPEWPSDGPMRDGTFRLGGLRAWRAPLAKKIADVDLLVGGQRPFVGGDNLLLPIAEMAGRDRIARIESTLIFYRIYPENNFLAHGHVQTFVNWCVTTMPEYARLATLDDPPARLPHEPTHALLITPGGKTGNFPLVRR